MLSRILHVSLETSNLAECAAFYTDVLQLRKLDRPDIAVSGMWLDAGGTHVHLNARPAAPTELPHPRHICFGAHDVERVQQQLERAGNPVLYAGSLAVPQLWTRDPAGNVIEFQPDGNRP